MAKKKRAAKRGGAKKSTSKINQQLILSQLYQLDTLVSFEQHVTLLIEKKDTSLALLITDYMKHFIALTKKALKIKERASKKQALACAIRLLPQLLESAPLDNETLLLVNAINNYQLQIGEDSAQTKFLVCNIKLNPEDKQVDAQNHIQHLLSLSQQYIKPYETHYNELKTASKHAQLNNTTLFKWLNELTTLYEVTKNEPNINLSRSILSAYYFIAQNILNSLQELIDNNLQLIPAALEIYTEFKKNNLFKKLTVDKVNTTFLPLFDLWDCYNQISTAKVINDLSQVDELISKNIAAFLNDDIDNISIAMLAELFFAKSVELVSKTEIDDIRLNNIILIYQKLFITLNRDKSLILIFVRHIKNMNSPPFLQNKMLAELAQKIIKSIKDNSTELFDDDIEQYYTVITALSESKESHCKLTAEEANTLLLEPFLQYCNKVQSTRFEEACSVLFTYLSYLIKDSAVINSQTIAIACERFAHFICRFILDSTRRHITISDEELEQLQRYMEELNIVSQTISYQKLSHYSKLFDGLYSLQQNMGSAYMDLSASLLSPKDHPLQETSFISPLENFIELSSAPDVIKDTALLMLVRDSLWLISSSYELILTEKLLIKEINKTKIKDLLSSIANNELDAYFDTIGIDNIAQNYSHTFYDVINEIIKALTTYIILAQKLVKNKNTLSDIQQRLSNYQQFVQAYNTSKEKLNAQQEPRAELPIIKANSLTNIELISGASSQNIPETLIDLLTSTTKYLPKRQLTAIEENNLINILNNIRTRYISQNWMSTDTPAKIIALSAALVQCIKSLYKTYPCPLQISDACFNLLVLPIKALVENNQQSSNKIKVFGLALLPLVNENLKNLGYQDYVVAINENNQYVQKEKTRQKKQQNKKLKQQTEKAKNSPAQPTAKPIVSVVIQQPVPIKPPSPETVKQLESKVSQNGMFSTNTSPSTRINSKIQDKVKLIEQSFIDLNKNPNKENTNLVTHHLSKLLEFTILDNDNFDTLSDKQKNTLLMYIDNKLIYLSSILFTCDSETGISLLNNEHQLLLKKMSHTANSMSDDNWACLSALVTHLNHAKQKHPYKSVVTIDTSKAIINYHSKKLFSDNTEHNITPILQECQVLLHKLERADANTKKEHIHFIQKKLDLLITTLFKSGTTIERITTETFYKNLQKQKSLAQDKWDNPSEQNQLKFACAQTYNTYLRCLHTKIKLPIDKQYPDYWQQLAQMVIAIKTIERQATDTEESSSSMTLTLGM